MRAGSLQELVYKQGQAGVTKASVSIVFNNLDKPNSPVGYEQYDQITVTRQVRAARQQPRTRGFRCMKPRLIVCAPVAVSCGPCHARSSYLGFRTEDTQTPRVKMPTTLHMLSAVGPALTTFRATAAAGDRGAQ